MLVLPPDTVAVLTLRMKEQPVKKIELVTAASYSFRAVALVREEGLAACL